MKNKWARCAFTAITFLSALSFNLAPAIAANTILLDPPVRPILGDRVMVGDRITFDLLMNFSDDPTVGGGVDIHYDPAYLEFVRFDFDSDFRGDPFYNRQPIVIPGGVLSSLSFGDFNGVSIGKVGMFTFQALERGTSHITLLSDGLPGDLHLVAGRFFSAVSFSEQAVSFSGATVTVVPEPEIWGMLLAGIGLIGWWARSQRARRAPAPVAPG